MLVIWLKKEILIEGLVKIENKVNDHNHDKYITTPEFNTLAADAFSDRVTKNKAKYLLVKNELKKLQKFDAAYF